MDNNLGGKAVSAQHKSLEERLTAFYGIPIERVPHIESQELDWGKPVGNEEIKERLLDELVDILDVATEENFDEQRLNEILDELDELDPIPPGTFKSTEESLKEFWEKYGYLRNQLPSDSNDGEI